MAWQHHAPERPSVPAGHSSWEDDEERPRSNSSTLLMRPQRRCLAGFVALGAAILVVVAMELRRSADGAERISGRVVLSDDYSALDQEKKCVPNNQPSNGLHSACCFRLGPGCPAAVHQLLVQ